MNGTLSSDRPMKAEREEGLRPGGRGDVDDIRACVRAAYRKYVPRMGKEPGPMLADFESQVAAGQVTVLESAGRVRGLIVMFPQADHLFVENVAVWPDEQGHGYGRRLLLHAESEARRLGLGEIRLYTEVRMTENLDFYPAIGYEETGRCVESGYRRVYFRKRLA